MAWSEPGAGELNTRLQLTNIGRVKTPAGGFTRADVNGPEVWAKVEPAKWMQVQRAQQLQQRVNVCAVIRWQPGLAESFGPEAVVSYTDRAGKLHTLAVRTVIDPNNAGRFLELGCEEGAPV